MSNGIDVVTHKNWRQSKTLWVNATAAALVAFEATFGLLQPVLPVNFYAVIASALPVVNAVLRVVTKQGLTR